MKYCTAFLNVIYEEYISMEKHWFTNLSLQYDYNHQRVIWEEPLPRQGKKLKANALNVTIGYVSW